MYSNLNHDDTDDAIGKREFSNGIHFHVTYSLYYKEMACAIVVLGLSHVPLGKHKSRTIILKRPITWMYSKLKHDDIDDAIGKIEFSDGIHFHVTYSLYYKEMVCAIVVLRLVAA